jgi:alpha-beta hydrolase superfamily lysophospholipase
VEALGRVKRVALFLLVLLAGCTTTNFIKTRDGREIAYDYHESGWKGVILVHQLDGDRSDWESLEGELQEEGFSYIAIDLRGHGESQGEWEYFDSNEFRDIVYDVEAAHNFLKLRGVNTVAIVGASLGANVAMKYALWKGMGRLVLLSPGFAYKGVDISDDISNYTGRAMVLVGKSDSYAYTTGKVFERELNASFVTVIGTKHGTQMLPGVNAHIMAFLRQA